MADEERETEKSPPYNSPFRSFFVWCGRCTSDGVFVVEPKRNRLLLFLGDGRQIGETKPIMDAGVFVSRGDRNNYYPNYLTMKPLP